MTIREEAARGRLEGLTAFRGHLTDGLDDATSTDVRSLSAIAGQLRKTLEEIEHLSDEPAGRDVVDELLRRRADRLLG